MVMKIIVLLHYLHFIFLTLRHNSHPAIGATVALYTYIYADFTWFTSFTELTFLDAIASPSSYPCQLVQWASELIE